jgi:uncharacterized protein DUF4276
MIQPIVEGYGEVAAVPVLLRRFQDEAKSYGFQIAKPIRRKRSELTTEIQVRRSVRLALGTPNCVGVLIVFDSDDDCPKHLGPTVQGWAQAEAGAIPCEVVVANREYEAWFISAIESLRGVRGVRQDATSHPAPETIRDCKGALEDRMDADMSYSPRVDQAALTAQLDFRQAHVACRSFRRMTKAFGNLARANGVPINIWPPNDWL